MKKIKNLIFDMDGTLWDCTDKAAEAYSELLLERPELMPSHYPITSTRLKAEFGKTIADIGLSLFPELEPEDSNQLVSKMCANVNTYLAKHPGQVYPGMEETLRKLAKTHRLFIVSNCYGGYPEVFYENTGLGHLFEDHLCPSDTGLMKGDNIRIMCERYGLEDAAYIGDTAGDEKATRQAGIAFIHAAYGFGNATAPDAVINAPEDLLTLLK
ncbi:MAG: HAD family hydrolase [Lachnospiraceae bacterium]|nr:HAD family hydrolase [Candidatus Equihabitans merdae]